METHKAIEEFILYFNKEQDTKEILHLCSVYLKEIGLNVYHEAITILCNMLSISLYDLYTFLKEKNVCVLTLDTFYPYPF
jgi:hypothetical protein